MSPNASASEVRWFMSEAIPELVALIRAHRQRLDAVHRSMESPLHGQIAQIGKTPISALVSMSRPASSLKARQPIG